MAYRFGEFSLDPDRLELQSGDTLVSLEPQVFSLLEYLMRNRDRVVSKDEIIDSVWHGRTVSDNTLNSRINAARRAVGDSGKAQRVIRTYPRRGFRFVAQVEVGVGASEPAGYPTPPKVPSIAVLPFANLNGDTTLDYFPAGIAEDIITELSRLSGLFVIARMSSFAYKDRTDDARQIARELGVRFLLEGSVRQAKGMVRISVQLIDGASGVQLWAERFDGEVGHVFGFQDQIVDEIVATTATRLTRAEQTRALRTPPGDLNAYDLLLQGVYFHHQYSREDNKRARHLFENAIELDGAYADAYACLAWTHVHDFNFGWSDTPNESLCRAVEFAEKAVSIDASSSKAHMVLGDAYIWLGRVTDAYAEGKRAVNLCPNSADANFLFAWYAAWAGEVEEAINAGRKAMRLDPNTGFFGYHFVLGHALFLDGQFAEAADHIQEAVRRKPDVWFPRWWLVAVLGHLGIADVARSHMIELARLRNLDPNELSADVQLLPSGMKYENPAHMALMKKGLEAAGLPSRRR